MYHVPNGVKAISFDIWKTLLRGNKAFTKARLRLVFDSLGLGEVDTEHLYRAYRHADRFYNNEAERQGVDLGMEERLGMIFRITGIDAEPPDPIATNDIQLKVADLRRQPQYMPSLIEPDLEQTLRSLLDEGYTLGLLSNTGMDNEHVMHTVLAELGIWDLFQVRVFSSEDGRAKPNPGLFRRMAGEFGLAPADVLHVGDNTNADYRASEAGMQAILYAPKGVPKDWNGHFITSMKQLLE